MALKEQKGQIKIQHSAEGNEPGSDLFRYISIWIDEYDDLFSDFDPRPYPERNISDDFLVEVRKVCDESKFMIGEIKLLVPEKVRNAEVEEIIKKRLHSFFRKSSAQCQLEVKRERIKGMLFTIAGFSAMIGASYLSYLKFEGPFMQIPIIILEPAGWFMVWTGLEGLIHARRQRNSELDFYLKVVKSKIQFISI